jgi:hypothetical protein
MPGFLKDARFWGGVIVGYLLVTFVPQLSFRASAGRSGVRMGA